MVRFAADPNHRYISRYPVPNEGRFAIVTDVGCGMRWTQAALKTRAPILRTAKSCGPDAPTLASSWRNHFRWRRWQESPVTGESAKETVKTTGQGRPDCLR